MKEIVFIAIGLLILKVLIFNKRIVLITNYCLEMIGSEWRFKRYLIPKKINNEKIQTKKGK